MAKPVACSTCGAVLDTHCRSASCRWLACLTPTCTARFYDLERGVLSRRDGTIERLGSPPIAPTEV